MGIKRVTHQQNLKIKAKVSKHDLQILNKIWRKDNVDSTVEMKGYVCLHSRQTCAEGHKNSHCGNHALEIESHWTEGGGFVIRAHVVHGQRVKMNRLLQLQSLMWLSLRQSPSEGFPLPPHHHDSLDC